MQPWDDSSDTKERNLIFNSYTLKNNLSPWLSYQQFKEL